MKRRSCFGSPSGTIHQMSLPIFSSPKQPVCLEGSRRSCSLLPRAVSVTSCSLCKHIEDTWRHSSGGVCFVVVRNCAKYEKINQEPMEYWSFAGLKARSLKFYVCNCRRKRRRNWLICKANPWWKRAEEGSYWWGLDGTRGARGNLLEGCKVLNVNGDLGCIRCIVCWNMKWSLQDLCYVTFTKKTADNK